MPFKEKYTITARYLPKPSKRRSGLIAAPIRFLVAHDTGNPNSTASNNVAWYIRSKDDASASAHIFVDDKQIIECIPALTGKPEKAWHVLYNVPKDNELYGVKANDAAIGIEYCFGDNIDAGLAYEKYLWVLAKCCFTFGLDPSRDIIGHCLLDPKRKTDPITGLAQSRRTYKRLLRDIVTEYNDCTGNGGDIAGNGKPANDISSTGTATTVSRLNLRVAPTTRSPVIQVLPAHTRVHYKAIEMNGEPINNNPVWYQAANGNWFWSGGVVR
jgi:N-acetylmuramoyl-L-alanine amidase CwlA